MKKMRLRSGSVALGSAFALGMFVFVFAFASCATNVDEDVVKEDAASAVPEVNAPELEAGADASVPEAGCDASDPSCVTEMLPCSAVSWCLAPSPLDPAHALTAIWGSSKDDVWAVGAGGTILHYDGTTWVRTPTGKLETLYNVWGSGPGDVWAVAHTGLVLHSDGFANGSAVWQNMPPTERSTNEDVVSSGRRIFALWGSSANDLRFGLSTPHSLLFGLSSADLFFAGNSSQYVKSAFDDGGLAWREIPGNAGVRAIWGSSANDVWMSVSGSFNVPGAGPTILHGVPYEGPPPSPALATNPDCYFGCEPGCSTCAMLEDPLSWTPVDTQTWHLLEGIWGSSANDVWAVGPRGTIRRYRTGDSRWQPIDAPTQEDLHAVWGSGPNDVWFVGDGGTILHYDGAALVSASVQLPLGPRPRLFGVWGSGPNDVWIVGDAVVLHYTGPKEGGSK
ncbi:MAG: Type fimbrial biosis protein PilY1 [Labilithrix sp.]|nr:Type fimbrial biosis protein PilY1 [Labilithrix sp.]